MDRKFFFKRVGFGGCFCSACGKKVMQDDYNRRRHGVECGFDEDDNFTPVKEDETGVRYGYRLEKVEDELVFSICRAKLLPRPGFRDRYRGVGWTPTYEVRFLRNSKTVYGKHGEETDLEKLKLWLEKIQEGSVVRIHKGSDSDVIRTVFPTVQEIFNLDMFLYIYLTRGYAYREVLPEHAAKKVIARKKKEEKQEEKPEDVTAEAEFLGVKGTEDYLLKLSLYFKSRVYRCLASKDYFYSEDAEGIDFSDLMTYPFKLDEASVKAVLRFDEKYPQFHLKAYFRNLDTDVMHPSNVLVPLLAEHYHPLTELAVGAGIYTLATRWELSAFWKKPEEIRNLKESFGLPVSVLRRLGIGANRENSLATIRKTMEKDPALVNVEPINMYMVSYYEESGLSGDPHPFIRWIRPLSLKEHLKILRFLSEGSVQYVYFRDYLNICYDYGSYPEGLCPKDAKEAHDQVLLLVKTKEDREKYLKFRSSLEAPEYQCLASEINEEEEELFRTDPFMIVLPQNENDLFMEGRNMHNCVWTYRDSVANGRTRIVFLRKKNEPEKAFGTLEVLRDGRLIQAKAFANKTLPKKAQFFVRKWALAKGLSLATYDLRETEGKIAV